MPAMPDHVLVDILIREGRGKSLNGSSKRIFVCSCGRTFVSPKLSIPGSVEGALGAFLAHRSPLVARSRFVEGDKVIVIDEAHARYDAIGTVRVLGDLGAFVSFDFGVPDGTPSEPNVLVPLDALTPWGWEAP